jgi:hypothetical protein
VSEKAAAVTLLEILLWVESEAERLERAAAAPFSDEARALMARRALVAKRGRELLDFVHARQDAFFAWMRAQREAEARRLKRGAA